MDYYDGWSDSHLMSHRHGLEAIDWSFVGGVLAILVVAGAIAAIVFFAVKSSECPPTVHQGKQVCQTTGPDNTVVYVPMYIWNQGGYYGGVYYGSGGSGSSYSSYGSDDTSDDSDSGFSSDDSFSDGGDDGLGALQLTIGVS